MFLNALYLWRLLDKLVNIIFVSVDKAIYTLYTIVGWS